MSLKNDSADQGPLERQVSPLADKLRDAAHQAGHYGAWSGGVLLELAAEALGRYDDSKTHVPPDEPPDLIVRLLAAARHLEVAEDLRLLCGEAAAELDRLTYCRPTA